MNRKSLTGLSGLTLIVLGVIVVINDVLNIVEEFIAEDEIPGVSPEQLTLF